MESGYWDDFDDNTKYALGRQALEPLATFASGSVKENREDEKLYFGGKYLDRTFRVLIDMSWGKPKLEIKVANDKGYLNIDFDTDKKPQAPADPDWDDDVKPRHFLAPGVLIEDSQEDLDRQRAMLVGLAPNLIVQLHQQTNLRYFSIGDEAIEVDFDDVITAGPIAQRMQVACDTVAKILRELKL